MNLSERYELAEGIDSLSLRPYKSQSGLSTWFLAGIVISGLILPLFRNRVGEAAFFGLLALVAYGIFHSLYDILIRARICFTFDSRSNVVYREVPYIGQREILRLDDVVIFTSAETASWRYAIGAKKSHFVKSYGISEYFSAGKTSKTWQQQYEDEILVKIYQLIDKAKGNRSK